MNPALSGSVMTMVWIFSGLMLASAGAAAFVTDFRRVIMGLWVAGLAAGGIYLTLGAEFLAIAQWIISTLIAIAFLFFSVMFGQYGESERPGRELSRIIPAALSVLMGLGFTLLIATGARQPPREIAMGPINPATIASANAPSDLGAVGETLTERHLLSLETLAITFFIALIGSGAVARPEGVAEGVEKPEVPT